MASKFLDYTGLSTFWTKVKTWVSSAVTTNTPSTSKTVTGWNEGKVTYGDIQIAESQVTNLTTDLSNKAPLASPALTGTPTAPTAATGTDTTQIATTAFVNAEIESKMSESDAMVYKGTLAGGSSGDYGALTPAASKGWTYKVTTAGKIDGVAVEIGDMLICNTDSTAAATASNYQTVVANWDFIQGNQDGVVIGPASATSGNIALFDGATGKLIKDGGKNESNLSVLEATKLTNARGIDGVSFDGSANIHRFGSCTTAAATAAKTVTLSDSMAFTLYEGASVFVKFQYANGVASPTLDVNGTGAKSIYRYGTTAPSTTAKTSWQANSVVHLVYDGSAWQMVGWLNDDTTYSNASLGQGYGTCSTAEATAAKAVTLSGYTLATGGIVAVKFTYGLCASATMNINSKGAKSIFIHGAAVTATTAKEVKAGDIAYFIYDGTQYQFLGTDRMEKDAVVGFSDTGTAGTDAKVQYEKGDGIKGDLMVAITDVEINALT